MLRACRSIQKKYLLLGFLCVFLLDFFGFFARLFEEDFNEKFHYPYAGDVSGLVSQLEAGLRPNVSPINLYNYTYLIANERKCSRQTGKLRLVYVVKSSLNHFDRRLVIRRTWGFEGRFSDVKIHTVFMLGNTNDERIRRLIAEESDKYGDIVQVDFVDDYYNNTIKTMSAFKWIVEYCPDSRYYFFSDDDMYISTKNVLRFLHNPTQYPDYLQLPTEMQESESNTERDKNKMLQNIRAHMRQAYKYDLPENVTLYAGHVFLSSPLRHKSSKWYVSLKEYPYNLWPPYIAAGAYVLSKNALVKLYYGSFYTKHFRFDDIYLALVALKVGIQPFHCDKFHFYKNKHNSNNYKYVISSHGYDDPQELQEVWNKEKEAGNA